MLTSRQLRLVFQPFCLKLSANLLIFRFFLERSDLQFAPPKLFSLICLPTMFRKLSRTPIICLLASQQLLLASHSVTSVFKPLKGCCKQDRRGDCQGDWQCTDELYPHRDTKLILSSVLDQCICTQHAFEAQENRCYECFRNKCPSVVASLPKGSSLSEFTPHRVEQNLDTVHHGGSKEQRQNKGPCRLFKIYL